MSNPNSLGNTPENDQLHDDVIRPMGKQANELTYQEKFNQLDPVQKQEQEAYNEMVEDLLIEPGTDEWNAQLKNYAVIPTNHLAEKTSNEDNKNSAETDKDKTQAEIDKIQGYIDELKGKPEVFITNRNGHNVHVRRDYEIEQLEARRAELENSMKTDAEQANQKPEDDEKDTPKNNELPELTAHKKERDELEARIQQLLGYGVEEDDPSVVEMQKELEALNQIIEVETERDTLLGQYNQLSGYGVEDDDPTVAEILDQLAKNEAKLQALYNANNPNNPNGPNNDPNNNPDDSPEDEPGQIDKLPS